MIYRFKLVSDEADKFRRDIEIDSEATFLDLRDAVLESVGYTKDEMCSFFCCDDDWSKREEITLEDMGKSSDEDTWLMEDTRLDELIEEESQRLIFVFDYLTDRSFFMELKKIIPGKNLLDPVCTLKEGKAPKQHVDLEEFEEKLDRRAAAEGLDIDEELYGSDRFNEDELPEGFEEMD